MSSGSLLRPATASSDDELVVALPGTRPTSPVADQLQARVDTWEQCPAPRLPRTARLIGAEIMGWGDARAVVVLYANPTDTNVQLLTYNLKLQEWEETNAEGEVPPLRTHASVCSWRVLNDTPSFAQYRRTAKLLLYGGKDRDGRCSDALYCLTASETIPTPGAMLPGRKVMWRWSRVKSRPNTVDSPFSCPTPRAFHAMCSRENTAYVHGGLLADGTVSAEFWELRSLEMRMKARQSGG